MGVHPFAGDLIKLRLADIDLSNLDSFLDGPPWDDFDYLRSTRLFTGTPSRPRTTAFGR